MSIPSVDSSLAMASLAVLGERHVHAVLLEHAREREDVAHVVVDDQHVLAGEHRVGVVQPLEHAPLLLGKPRLHAVEEERRLVEQTLRRLDVLDDDRLGELLEPRLLLLAEILAGVDDDRQLLHRRDRTSRSPAAGSHRCRRTGRGRAPCSRSAWCAASPAPRSAVATSVISTSSWAISSTMLCRWPSSSSTTSSRFTC